MPCKPPARALLILGLISLTACSSSKTEKTAVVGDPVASETEVAEGLGSPYVWVDSTRSSLRTGTGIESAHIGRGGEVIFATSAPSGYAVVYAAEMDGRIELTYVEMESGAFRVLHTGRAPLVYSGAWSPDEQSFSFGYFSPVEGGGRRIVGEGEIMVLNRETGRLQKAGCTSSQVVVSWPRPDTLLVRNDDNLYGVSPLDCATRTTIDIRKWHHITASPDGKNIAYVLRDLAYNKETREYEPDSVLYIVPAGQDGGTLVVGDRYRPRNMAWAANSSELAFDVLEKRGEEKRVVFVYQVAEDKRFMLNNASVKNPSETHPSYYGGSDMVYFLANGKNLMVGAASGNDLFTFQLEEGLGKPVNIMQLPLPGTTLVTVESGDVYRHSNQTKSSYLIGRGTAVIPETSRE